MLTIYGDSISGNCLKVKWTCNYLAIKYRWIETSVLTGATRTADFLALNSAGQVPLLELENGLALAQSNAIITYLAEGSSLIPSNSYQRAKMLEWLFWEQYSHEPYVAVARFQLRYLNKTKDELDPKVVDRGIGALKRLEEMLATSDYLVGSELTLADVALVAYTRVAPEGGFDLVPYGALQAWIRRVESTLQITD